MLLLQNNFSIKLHELIDALDGGGHQAVEIGKIQPYRNLLRAYFQAYYRDTPVLIPIMVTNSLCYCLIAPGSECTDAVIAYDEEAAGDEELMEQYLQYIKPL